MDSPSAKRAPLVALASITLLTIAVAATNYTPDAWLMGWDNLLPELNFPANLMRSVVGVWQEVRGAGVVDGMSHIANIPHTLLLWLMSLILPTSLLRFAFTFLMYGAGGMGMYMLVSLLIRKTDKTGSTWSLAGLLAGIFYLTNLATIQIFFTPLEAFVVHFAALPWLAFSLLSYLNKPSRKTLILFFLITLAATPQFFVPTILLPVTLLLATLALPPFASPSGRKSLLLALAGFLLINAFWLLPWLATVGETAPVVAAAKINQMSSAEAYLRNVAYGSPLQVLTHQGFMLRFEDIAVDGSFYLPMEAWTVQMATPVGLAVRLTFAALAIMGATITITKRKRALYPFVLLFVLSFLFLANNTPGIREATEAIRGTFPLLSEALRFPFTKWALLFALATSILLAYGVHVFLTSLASSRMARRALAGILLIALGFGFAPAFIGNFLYKNLRISLPSEYQEFFTTMNSLPSGRIALFPQADYWSWKYYRFGLRGSGFIWHGMTQPVMDRAFDPWSATNENYFWQLTLALYRKDPQAVEKVLNRYNIRYVLLDNNVVSPSHARALFTEEIEALLPLLPSFGNKQTFGNLSLYSRINPESNTFISLQNSLPKVFPAYEFSDEDTPYGELGNYQTAPSPNDADIVYPYRSLLTKRSVNAQEFTIKETASELTIVTPGDLPGTASATISKEASLVFDTQDSQVLNTLAVIQCGLLKSGVATSGFIDGVLRMKSANQRGCASFSLGALPHAQGYLVAVTSQHIEGRPLLFSLINQTAKHTEIEAYLPTDTEEKTSYFVLPPLAHDGLGYSAYLSNDAIGNQTTVNELLKIAVYSIPYADLLSFRMAKQNTTTATESAALEGTDARLVSVWHPNPSYYKLTLDLSQATASSTLILSQAYNPGWKAYALSGEACWGCEMLPFFFGRELHTHTMVNNWANGWEINPAGGNTVVIFFFIPQLWQYLGFALLPLPFLLIMHRKKQRPVAQ